MTTPPSPWSNTARTMRQRVDAAMDHMADLIKDALLDGIELPDEDEMPGDAPALIDPDELVARMRERVEQTLRHVAEGLNAGAGGEASRELFAELWREALKMAAELRLGAALGEAPPVAEAYHGAGPPDGEWARRYRVMHADDPE